MKTNYWIAAIVVLTISTSCRFAHCQDSVGTNRDFPNRPATIPTTETADVILAQYGLSKANKQAVKLSSLEPKSYEAIYGQRAVLAGRYKIAIEKLDTAIEQREDLAFSYYWRGMAKTSIGECKEATKDYFRALIHEPNLLAAMNNIAWIYATDPRPSVRYPSEAVKYARMACIATGWKDGFYLDTLATSYAASGNFDSAVSYQKKAASLAPKGYEDEINERLRQFKRGYAYRQPIERRLGDPGQPQGFGAILAITDSYVTYRKDGGDSILNRKHVSKGDNEFLDRLSKEVAKGVDLRERWVKVKR